LNWTNYSLVNKGKLPDIDIEKCICHSTVVVITCWF